ncbi:hypothetical protein [Schnuerera ultunensis]|uniref:Uncharacterized protein n=1 Tax=[Clostridium] ultunense Esp TaxID=1288971 RepID=A0A1M4PM42_9FIRM|nr:hypothetical protein [Schnuerera ultunensis]SHD76532.1 protein of unknown function [[Clostridium] ultunense Esp]
MLVNGSEVTLTGAIDVSGNEFGGIESSKGVGVGTNPKLTVTDATFTNGTEAYGLPTIWEDQITGTVVAADEQFTVNEEVREGQVQYYLKEENAEPTKPSLKVTSPAEEVSAEAEEFEITFAVTHDKELEYLEIDHNLGKHGSVPYEEKLPEFKLYPNVDNPWAPTDMEEPEAGNRKTEATEQGLEATYSAGEKTWTLTFGKPVLNQIRNLTAEYSNNEFRIYSLVRDIEGVQSGSMHDGGYETTIVTLVIQALPEQSTYKLTHTGLQESYTAGDLIDVTGKTQEQINTAVAVATKGLDPVKVTLATDVLGKTGYDAVRILPVNAGENIQLWAKDTSNNWYDINVTGWGDLSGFKLDAQYNVTTDIYVVSDKAGDYELKIELVDLSDNKVIADASGTITVEDSVVTSLTMNAANVDATTGEEFTMAVTAQGTVADGDKDNLVRFYGVIPGLSASDIEFATISGGTPDVVTDATERGYAGASQDDLVLAWGPAGGFPLKDHNYSQGVTTEFKATINKTGTYIVRFVFYDLDANKQINGADETATIALTEDLEAVAFEKVKTETSVTVPESIEGTVGEAITFDYGITYPAEVSDVSDKWHVDGKVVSDKVIQAGATLSFAGATYTVPEDGALSFWTSEALGASARPKLNQDNSYTVPVTVEGLPAGTYNITFSAIAAQGNEDNDFESGIELAKETMTITVGEDSEE